MLKSLVNEITLLEAHNKFFDLYFDQELDLETVKQEAITILEDENASGELKELAHAFTDFYKECIKSQVGTKELGK